MRPEDDWLWGGWPTLGFLIADWIEWHCPIPDGFRRGQPFEMYDWQLFCTLHHYRVKPSAILAGVEHHAKGKLTSVTSVASAFHSRRSQVVGPQKCGKGPWTATLALAEGCGPVVFDGFATEGEIYDCAAHGCPCGWTRWYEPGEPKGKRWPTPLIQLTATAADQIHDNVYKPLKEMAEKGPLAALVRPMEGYAEISGDGGDDGRIDVVTSNARSRLGNPVTFVLHDESGLYTTGNGMIEVAKTQRRGVTGMGGRALETTNAWDPREKSQAQRTAESKRPDIWRYHREPPEALNYRLKVERKKIHAYVYAGVPHVDLTLIEAEAAEMMEHDAAGAERFYGNRVRAGASRAVDMEAWDGNVAAAGAPPGAFITIGIDGARFRDGLAMIGTEVITGFQWPIGIWEVPDDLPEDELDSYEHPKDEVDAELDAAMGRYQVWRVYVDPGGIDEWVRGWQGRYGKDRIITWYMHRLRPTAYAVRRWIQAIHAGDQSHSGDPRFTRHVRNAHRRYVNVYDDDHRQMFVIAKERQDSPEKMDGSAAAVLGWEARGDAIAAGAQQAGPPQIVIST
jgi:hypothetical protein